MHFNRFTAVASLLLASASVAHATRNPTPPPSGIVVHLFGPQGIMTPILPQDDTAHGTQGQTGGQAPSAGSAPGATAAATDSANSLQTSDDPSIHDILHQMFVTGDPNDPNKPATGRPGERQHVAQ